MNRIYLFVAVLVIQLLTTPYTAMASEVGRHGEKNSADIGTSKTSPDGKQLNAAIREAVFRNREQLLSFLRDRKTRSVICTPAPNDSYELFQASIHEQLDVLSDLDIYAAKYGLSKKEHDAVKACSVNMEKYLDNFELWEELMAKGSAR